MHDRGRGRDLVQQRPNEIRANPAQFDFGTAAHAVGDDFYGCRRLGKGDGGRGVARCLRGVVEDHILPVDAQPAAPRAVDDKGVGTRRIHDQRAGDLHGVVVHAGAGEVTVAIGKVAIHTVGKIHRAVIGLGRFVQFVLPRVGPGADKAERTLQITLAGERNGCGGLGKDPPRGEAGRTYPDRCGLVHRGRGGAGAIVVDCGDRVGRGEQRGDGCRAARARNRADVLIDRKSVGAAHVPLERSLRAVERSRVGDDEGIDRGWVAHIDEDGLRGGAVGVGGCEGVGGGRGWRYHTAGLAGDVDVARVQR